MELKRRSDGERKAFNDGYMLALKQLRARFDDLDNPTRGIAYRMELERIIEETYFILQKLENGELPSDD